MSGNSAEAGGRRRERLLIGVCLLSVCAVLGRPIALAGHGLDLTDEGFYLIWMSDPFRYDAAASLFGFVLHPVYRMLEGDIALLRRVNILVTFGIAFGLCLALLRMIAPALPGGTARVAASAGLATGGLVVFDSWLVTPNYNSLALQALLLATTGLVLTDATSRGGRRFGWLLLAVGGWLAFMAKPTTAAGLMVGMLCHLLLAGRVALWPALVAILLAVALLAGTALLIDGSIPNFTARLQTGMALLGRLESGHGFSVMLRIDRFDLGVIAKITMLLLAGAAAVLIWTEAARRSVAMRLDVLTLSALLGVTLALSVGLIHSLPRLGVFQNVILLGLAVGIAAAALFAEGAGALRAMPRAHWALAALFLAMPHLFALGTNNNYWKTGGAAALFWVLAGLVMLGPLLRRSGSWRPALAVGAVVPAAAAILMQTGFEKPYRQPQALHLNDAWAGVAGSSLALSRDAAAFLGEAGQEAAAAGFRAGLPLIDLTGQSPGLVFVLGGEAPGQPWLFGGYPGSAAMAEAALRRAPCDRLAQAWVLHEADGPRSLPDGVMDSIGAVFPQDYTPAASWTTAAGTGGHAEARAQVLYRPAKAAATLARCRAMRDGAAE